MSASVAQTNRSRHLHGEVGADRHAHHQELTPFCTGLFRRSRRSRLIEGCDRTALVNLPAG
jgi:hypothetical protein